MKAPLFKFLLALISGVIIIFLYWFFFKTPFLVLNLSPEESLVKIDGEEITLNNDHRLPLKRGEHTIVIYKEGFVPWQKKIKISALKKNELSVVLKTIPTPVKLLEEPVLDFRLENDWLYFLNKAGFISKMNPFTSDTKSISIKSINVEAFPLSQNFEIKNNYLLIKTQNKYILYDANAYQISGGRIKELPEGVLFATFSYDGKQIATVLGLPSGQKEVIIYDLKLKPLVTLDARRLNFPLRVAWLKDDSSLLVIENSGGLYLADLLAREFKEVPLAEEEKALSLKSNPYNNLVAIEIIKNGKVLIKIWDSSSKNFLAEEKETALSKTAFLAEEEALVLFSKKEGEGVLEKWQPRQQIVTPLYFSNPLGLVINNLAYSPKLNAILFSDQDNLLYKLLIEDGRYQ